MTVEYRFSILLSCALLSACGFGIPSQQSEIIDIIDETRTDYQEANNLVKPDIARKRANLLCSSLPSRKVQDWTGEIDSISIGMLEERAIFSINFGPEMQVKTWGDIGALMEEDESMKKGSVLYNRLRTLKVGDTVRFSGEFISDKQDCFQEASITEGGKMREPEFIFKFTDFASD